MNLEEIQEDILETLGTGLAQPVVEQAIVDIDNVKRNLAGDIDPYFAVQLAMPSQQGATSFGGPRHDDYVQVVYIQAVAPTPEIARKMSNKLWDLFLGSSAPWTGSVRQRSGGAFLPMVNSNNATEAYVMPSSFGVTVQLE